MRGKPENKWVKDILGDANVILVLAALSMVNFTEDEYQVIKYRFLDGKTQNKVAEILDVDVRTVQRRESEALKKCSIVWKNHPLAKLILKRQKENIS